MADITITSTGSYVKAVFNSMSSAAGMTTGYFRDSDIAGVYLHDSPDVVEVVLSTGHGHVINWTISHTGTTGALTVDSVNGTTPTTNSQLASLVAGLIKT